MGPSSISPSNSDVYAVGLSVIRMSVCAKLTHAACLCLGIRSGGREEEEKIDVDLDFEAAKSTRTLHNSCRRPVTERSEEGEHC